MRDIKLSSVPLFDIKDGLCIRFDKPDGASGTCFATADIHKHRIIYELPEENDRKVIAVYLKIE